MSGRTLARGLGRLSLRLLGCTVAVSALVAAALVLAHPWAAAIRDWGDAQRGTAGEGPFLAAAVRGLVDVLLGLVDTWWARFLAALWFVAGIVAFLRIRDRVRRPREPRTTSAAQGADRSRSAS